jgi:MFS family permease
MENADHMLHTNIKRDAAAPHLKYFLIFGLMSASWNSIWGIYNNYVPIILQAGNPTYDLASQGTSYGFGLSPFWTGTVMSIDNILGLILCLVIGAISDRIQRRSPFILFGLSLAITGSVLLPVAASLVKPEMSGSLPAAVIPFIAFLVCAMVLSIGYFLANPMTGALVLDTIPPAQHTKTFSYILFFSGFLSLLVYLTSGRLYSLSQVFPFALGAVALLIALVSFKVFIKEPRRVSRPGAQEWEAARLRSLFSEMKRLTRQEAGSLMSMVITILCFQFGFAAFQSFASSYALNVLHIPEANTIFLVILFQTGFLLTTYWTHLISAKIGRKATLRLGLLGNVLFPLIAYFILSPTLIYAVFLIFGVCFTLFYVNQIPVIGSIVTSGNMAGKLVGINWMTVSLSTLVAVPVSGWLIGLSGNNYNLLWLITAVTMMAGFFMSLGVRGGEASAVQGADPGTAIG